ncbi:hypothetical protein NXV15_11585 [Bacteroides thetaiotaomicron]|nr:hypothetical protein [Bacteroides thetaiotaomicron]MCS2685165.1 hypothetical protein [Bacteroides thetaiotaomicron]
MNKKFDFSEIDGALPTAEKMQEQDRIIDALKNNYEAVRILSANVEKLENRLSEALPKMDGAVSSLRGASTVALGEEARKTLEQEGRENLPEDGRQDGTGMRKASRTPLGE